MKKVVSVLLVFVMAFVLAACGGGGNNVATPAPPPPPTPVTDDNDPPPTPDAGTEVQDEVQPERTITVGFAQIGSESDWRVGSTNSILSAVEEAGFEMHFVDANQVQERQISALRDFITMGVDYIGFSPVVETGWDLVMQEIRDAGIPVIMLDRNIEMPNRDDYYVTWIGANFVREGERAAEWLIDYLEHIGRSGDDINIVELQGTVGSSPAIDRKTGFENVIANHPNLTISQSQTGDFTTELGKEVMEGFLIRAQADGVPIDVVYAHNDGMAIGAIQAIREAGLNPGVDIIIIGVDAVKLAFEAIIAGDMNATIECSPLLGPQFVETIQALERGETVPKIIYSNYNDYDDVLYQIFPDRFLSVREHVDSRVY